MPTSYLYLEPVRSSPHTLIFFFLNIHLNIILPPTSASPKSFFPSDFLHQKRVYASPAPIRATCSTHLIILEFVTRKIFGKGNRSFTSSLCSFLHSPVTSSPLSPNILLSTLFSNTFSLRSSHNVGDQVSHPHKTTSKIIFHYILIFNFLIANRKTIDSAPNASKHSQTSIRF